MTNGDDTRAPEAGRYASVNGLEMYYEIHGSGPPLVLLHGAFSAIGTSFGELLPALAETRQVIAFELQGHGRTASKGFAPAMIMPTIAPGRKMIPVVFVASMRGMRALWRAVLRMGDAAWRPVAPRARAAR